MPNPLATSIAALAARITSLLGPRGMRVVALFNKHVNNPLQRLWAPRLPYMAIIEHEGRTSRKGYRTPVMAFVEDGAISVVLNYGTGSDWVRNVRAAGSAGVVHRGRRYRLTDPRVIPIGSTDLPPAVRTSSASTRSALVGTLTPA
jgi:deazaflavin-dependent oxidoreductase (nitroreductase family)